MNDEHIEFLGSLLLWTMVGVAVFGLAYPWSPHWPLARPLVLAPLLLVPLWIVYELIRPEQGSPLRSRHHHPCIRPRHDRLFDQTPPLLTPPETSRT